MSTLRVLYNKYYSFSFPIHAEYTVITHSTETDVCTVHV